MKTNLPLAALFLSLAGAACADEWAIGRGALQLEASLAAVYDSNLNGSIDNRSDSYLSLYPVLRYRQTDARFKTDVRAGVRIKRYDEFTASNSEDADGRFDWVMTRDPDHTTGADLMLSYLEGTDAAYDINEQVRARLFQATANAEVLVARRSLLSAGLNYRDNDRDIGSDQSTAGARVGYSYVGFTDGTEVRINYLHQQSESSDTVTGETTLDQTARTLSASLVRPLYAEAVASFTYGYRWLDRSDREETMGLPDANGGFIGIALSGPFLPRKSFPKTSGTFRIAYEQADVPGLNDTSSERLVGQLNLVWQARERTRVTFLVRRAQDLSITDNTVVNTGGGVSVHQEIGAFFDADASIGYENADFIGWGRVDDRYTFRLSGRYTLNRTWSASAGYSYLESHSNEYVANFQRHVVNVALTYAF